MIVVLVRLLRYRQSMSPQIDNKGRQWIFFYLDEPEGSLGDKVIRMVRHELRTAVKELEKYTILNLAEKLGLNRQRTSNLIDKLNMKDELKRIGKKTNTD